MGTDRQSGHDGSAPTAHIANDDAGSPTRGLPRPAKPTDDGMNGNAGSSTSVIWPDVRAASLNHHGRNAPGGKWQTGHRQGATADRHSPEAPPEMAERIVSTTDPIYRDGMESSGTNAAVIVAAGRGMRVGGGVPKQWRALGGRRVVDWTIDVFRRAPGVDTILLVLHPDDMARATDFPFLEAVPGGSTRSASVRAGLEALVDRNISKVLIHDAARPLVTPRIIDDVLTALDTAVGATPALELTDALLRGTGGIVSGALERADLYRAQTPQGFRFNEILGAHRNHPGDAADDVEVARSAGVHVALVPGDERNLKITHAEDFKRAEAALGLGD